MSSPQEGRGSSGSATTQTITAIDPTWTSPQVNSTGHGTEVLLEPSPGVIGVATDGTETRITTSAGVFRFLANSLQFPRGQQLTGEELGDGCTSLITVDSEEAGSPAAGTLLYYNGTQWLYLPAGTNGQGLMLQGGEPVWAGVASLDAAGHVQQYAVADTTEASTNDTLGSTSSLLNNLNRIRYQLAQLGTGAWNTLRAMVQLSPASQQTGTINISGEIQGSDVKVAGITGATAASRYVGATTTGAPTTGTFGKGDFVVTQDGSLWICTTAGTPGIWTQVSGGGGASYGTLATRPSVGVTADKSFYVATDIAGGTLYQLENGGWVPIASGNLATGVGGSTVNIVRAPLVKIASNVAVPGLRAGIFTGGQTNYSNITSTYLETAAGMPNYGPSAGNVYPPVGGLGSGSVNFGIIWNANFLVTATDAGSWSFQTISDDGSDLQVDGVTVVSNGLGVGQGMTAHSGSITLAAGIHTLQVRYGQGAGGWGVQAQYQRPGDGTWRYLTDASLGIASPFGANLLTLVGMATGDYCTLSDGVQTYTSPPVALHDTSMGLAYGTINSPATLSWFDGNGTLLGTTTITPVAGDEYRAGPLVQGVALQPNTRVQLDYAASTDLANGVALSAATWTDVGSNQTFTVDDPNSVVEIATAGCIQAYGTAGHGCASRLVIDSGGTPIYKTLGASFTPATNVGANFLSGADIVTLTGLSAGTHTVKVQVWTDTTGVAAYCRASTPATIPYESLCIRVLERKQSISPPSSTPAPAVRCYNSVNVSIPNAAMTVLPFDTTRFDHGTSVPQHSSTVNTSRLTCQQAGVYIISGSIEFAASSVGTYRQCRILLNGTTEIGIGNSPPFSGSARASATVLWSLSVGDYVELEAYQDSGGALNSITEASFTPEFMMARVDTGALPSYQWQTKTSNYTVVPTDTYILADATSGPITITLPTAVGSQRAYTVKKKDSTANVVTVATSAGQLIDGASTLVIYQPFEAVDFVSDGSVWWAA